MHGPLFRVKCLFGFLSATLSASKVTGHRWPFPLDLPIWTGSSTLAISKIQRSKLSILWLLPQQIPKSLPLLSAERERERREKRERESAQERKNRRRERRVEKREKRESGCGRGKYRQKGFVCISLPLLVLLLLLEMRLFQYAIRTCVFPTNEVVSPLTYRFESILKKKRKTRERIKTRMEKCNFLFSSCCPMEGEGGEWRRSSSVLSEKYRRNSLKQHFPTYCQHTVVVQGLLQFFQIFF